MVGLRIVDDTNAPKHQVECGLLLDVIVAESASVLQLLAGENESLLVGGNTVAEALRMR